MWCNRFSGKWFLCLLLLPAMMLAAGAFVLPVQAQADGDLLVAVSDCPPFVMETQPGQFSGIAIDLWGLVARRLGVTYTFREYAWGDMLRAVERGEVDAAISCITITSNREVVMDFSHSFYDADLTAAVREPTTFDSLKSILSDWRTASVFAGMLLFSFVTGGTMWSLERKSNPQLFPKRGKLATLFDIFLFSITFITRGAKDYHSYNSQAARALAALGTFASALNLTAVTAVLASVLTTTTLQGTVSSPVDLQKMRVAAFEDSVGAQYLIDSRISYSVIDAPTDYDALVMLEELQFDAVISDGPVLQYAMKQGESSNRFGSIIIMPWSLQQQQYGIALPDGSPLREPINRILLDVLTSPAWDAILDSYLKY